MGLEAVLLRVVQLGDYNNGTTLAGKILLLTLSFLTYMVYAYYATEITAKMTSSPPEVSIKSFKDVLGTGDVTVIVVSGVGATTRLSKSASGTAKREVYDTMIDNNDEVWYPTTNDALKKVLSEPNHFLYRDVMNIFDHIIISYCCNVFTKR